MTSQNNTKHEGHAHRSAGAARIKAVSPKKPVFVYRQISAVLEGCNVTDLAERGLFIKHDDRGQPWAYVTSHPPRPPPSPPHPSPPLVSSPPPSPPRPPLLRLCVVLQPYLIIEGYVIDYSLCPEIIVPLIIFLLKRNRLTSFFWVPTTRVLGRLGGRN